MRRGVFCFDDDHGLLPDQKSRSIAPEFAASVCSNGTDTATYEVTMNAPNGSSLRNRTTTLLEDAGSSDLSALDELVPLVFDDHEMARRQLARERQNVTLQTTALIHEAYLRLVDDDRVTRRGRAYFFAAAARAMRQVLVDAARKRKAAKRGDGAPLATLDSESDRVDVYASELLDLDRALEDLDDAYLRGRYWWSTRTRDGLEKSLAYFIRTSARFRLRWTPGSV